VTGSGQHGEWIATTPEWWARVRYPIVAFRLWYADGSTFGGSPDDWRMAPVEGVQVLIVYHPHGSSTRRVIVDGKDEYTLPGQQGSKLGAWCDRFYTIQASAIADPWEP
jgi:hypothetical protein